jgi:hypothetical protein
MEPREYIAFDIEIFQIIPDGASDWMAFRPFGISCAATLASGEEPRVWTGKNPDGSMADRMSPDEVGEMVSYLADQAAKGKTIVTWNGMGFDFDVLAEESGKTKICQDLAWTHVDMMFHVFCLKGFAVGLDKAARGMAVGAKTEGMHGALAPKYWQEGRRDEVLEYVAQDVRVTHDLALAGDHRRSLAWIAGSGRSQTLPLPSGWLTAIEANKLPLPDTSWMRRPWKRSKFTGWAKT